LPDKSLHFFLKKRGLIQTWNANGLYLSLQPLDRFLILTKCLFKLIASNYITPHSNQNSKENGTEDDQKKRKRSLWNFKPLIIFYGENKTKGDVTSILNSKLNSKKDCNKKDQSPEQCLEPSHFFFLLSGLSFLHKRSINVE